MHLSKTGQPADNFTYRQTTLRDTPSLALLHPPYSKQNQFTADDSPLWFSNKTRINTLPVDELSNFLLDLWKIANNNSFDNFLEKASKLLGCYVPFDSAIWGSARLGADSHSVRPCIYRHGLPYQAVGTSTNILSNEVFAHPGIVFRYDNAASDADTSGMLELDRKHDICRSCGILQKRKSLLGLFIFLYRREDKPPFSAQEAHFLKLIVDHISIVVESYCSKLLQTDKNDISASNGVALLDQSSLLLLANKTFHDLISRHWPTRTWQDPTIPDELLNCIPPKRIRNLVASMEPIPGELFYLLSLRPERARDRLTVRQLEIAQAYADGMEYKHIARKLSLSPATVRNHLSNIYNQLQIKNKIELIAALQYTAKLSAEPSEK